MCVCRYHKLSHRQDGVGSVATARHEIRNQDLQAVQRAVITRMAGRGQDQGQAADTQADGIDPDREYRTAKATIHQAEICDQHLDAVQ